MCGCGLCQWKSQKGGRNTPAKKVGVSVVVLSPKKNPNYSHAGKRGEEEPFCPGGGRVGLPPYRGERGHRNPKKIHLKPSMQVKVALLACRY